ncbi:hypothetical protein [Thiorhodovibrio frisius]|uniref:DUF3782 domain-containing protein n=1 Tax=Thiorhodovibrio frisius TaxID=631362 RepID=H8YWE8_9GAMM|nr:hypothetical protein [Thiorhodovibrio frisius]EIC23666.1 hypothetical protein Thi970DRAFT_00408 [Thiorhodovibrio frisius]WPL22584.1 hypothetical protein Thiofri_02751 [Thiorhodovibrio frisius]
MTQANPTLDDVWRLFQETTEKFQETDRQFKETDRQFKETDRQFKETDRKFQETDRRMKELQNLFESQWGKLMESLVDGDLVNLLQARGIAITDTTTRLKGRLPDGRNYEFDILAHNGNEVVVVEVKTTLKPHHVRKFIERMNAFKTWLPRYADNRLYGAMAWLTADAGAENMLLNQGLFSIRATGDSAQIVNSTDFTPRAW